MDHFINDMASASIGSIMRKCKSDFLMGYGSDDSRDGNKKHLRLMYNASLSSFAQFGTGPIASFGMFVSLSNKSTKQPETQHQNAVVTE